MIPVVEPFHQRGRRPCGPLMTSCLVDSRPNSGFALSLLMFGTPVSQ